MGELDQTATEQESTTSPTATTARPKQTLGRYEIESVLGAGGMGVVYAAFDPELQRRVAVKLLPDAKRSQTARERLLREARAMARLTHPNVVRVYEVDSVDGHDFVAMELVEGGTLAEWLRAAKRSPDDIVTRFIGAGRGLAAAHAASVVHRDFKPHNVLCGADGRILVTDFGLAREVNATIESGEQSPSTPPSRNTPLNEITEAGSVLGTPAYMAPEQRAGEQVGASADQFAFCVALWEALTGKRPYRGSVDEVRQAYERGPAGLDASAVPRRLRATLLRGLEIDPAKRWPSMDVVLRQLSLGVPRRTALAITFGAVVVASVTSVLIARNHAEPCAAPVLDPAAVWSGKLAPKLAAVNQRGITRILDRDMASWKQVRAGVCKAERSVREPELACLDGVLARFDVVVRTAEASGGDIDPNDLIEPAICMRSTPPHLPRTYSHEFFDTMQFVMAKALEVKHFDAAVLDQVTARAKSEPCALALAYFIRARAAVGPADLVQPMRQAELHAEQCGDDHLTATILMFGATADVMMAGDTSAERARRARIAVDRIPTTDLTARLDMLSVFEDFRDAKIDDAIKHGNSAAEKFVARGCIDCATQAVITVAGIYLSRGTAADLEAFPRVLDRQRALIVDEVGLDSDDRREIDVLRARWLFTTGRLDEAHKALVGAHVEWPLTKPRHMNARVVDRDGKPVAGATITTGYHLSSDAQSAAFSFSRGIEQRSAKTDEHGEAAFDVESETEVIADLGHRRSQPMAVGDNVTLVLEPTSRITGKVALHGLQAATVTVQARAPNDDRDIRHWTMAPVHADGTFELAGVRRGKVQIRAGHGELGANSGTTLTIDVDKPVVSDIELSVGAAVHTVNVLVRSTVAIPVPEAMVSIYPGTVAAETNMKELTEREPPITSARLQRRELSTLPADVKALAHPGDLFATIERVPAELVSACALGNPHQHDMNDHLRDQILAHPERVQIRCVPVAADDKVIVIEVPPFPRFD